MLASRLRLLPSVRIDAAFAALPGDICVLGDEHRSSALVALADVLKKWQSASDEVLQLLPPAVAKPAFDLLLNGATSLAEKRHRSPVLLALTNVLRLMNEDDAPSAMRAQVPCAKPYSTASNWGRLTRRSALAAIRRQFKSAFHGFAMQTT